MSEIVRRDDSVYNLVNEADEAQIVNSEKYLTSGDWLYEVQGQHAMSYDGVRAFASWLARHGIVVQTVASDISVQGEGTDAVYHARVRVREAGTGIIYEGVGRQPQYGVKKGGGTYYDATAETKAHSKAERNGIRKHIPPDLIAQFVEEVKSTGKVANLDQGRDGGQAGSGPAGAGDGRDEEKLGKHVEKWCSCAAPKVRFFVRDEGEYKGLHTCVGCELPVRNAKEIIRRNG